MELRHLRYLVAVAEHRHFGRAAAALGITQPPLSQQIQALEAEVGAVLLTRSHQGAEPTAAGAVFLEHARVALAAAATAGTEARRIERGAAGRLAVGFTPSALDVVLPTVLTALRRRWPDIDLDPTEYILTADIVDALVRGEIDCAIGRLPIALAGRGEELLSLPLVDDRITIVLPRDHPLAGRTRIAVGRLRDEQFVLTPLEERPPRYWHMVCAAAGFEPRVAGRLQGVHTLVGMVAAGLGVGLVPWSARTTNRSDVSFVALSPAVLAPPLTLVWRATDDRDLVRRFVGVVRTVLGLAREARGAELVDRAYVAALRRQIASIR